MTRNDVEVQLDLQSDPLPADFLPLKCDACSGIFCADHVAYAQHHCGSAYQKVRGRSEGDGGDEWRMHAESPESFSLQFLLLYCVSETRCSIVFIEGLSRFFQDQRFG